MNEPREVSVREIGRVRDGDSIKYETTAGFILWEDNRIGSKTKGAIYDRYPNDEGATIMNLKLVILPPCR